MTKGPEAEPVSKLTDEEKQIILEPLEDMPLIQAKLQNWMGQGEANEIIIVLLDREQESYANIARDRFAKQAGHLRVIIQQFKEGGISIEDILKAAGVKAEAEEEKEGGGGIFGRLLRKRPRK